MATFYSNQFAAAASDVASNDPAYRASQGALGGHLVTEIARATTTGTATNDVIRMFRALHSSTRMYSLVAQCLSTPSQGIIDIGIHLSGFDHDGAEVDPDLFESAQAITGGLAATDVFLGASLTQLDRGKALWELLGLSEDPNVLYDITIKTTTAVISTSVEIMLVAGFLAND